MPEAHLKPTTRSEAVGKADLNALLTASTLRAACEATATLMVATGACGARPPPEPPAEHADKDKRESINPLTVRAQLAGKLGRVCRRAGRQVSRHKFQHFPMSALAGLLGNYGSDASSDSSDSDDESKKQAAPPALLAKKSSAPAPVAAAGASRQQQQKKAVPALPSAADLFADNDKPVRSKPAGKMLPTLGGRKAAAPGPLAPAAVKRKAAGGGGGVGVPGLMAPPQVCLSQAYVCPQMFALKCSPSTYLLMAPPQVCLSSSPLSLSHSMFALN
jgi:hypothetical protein